MPFDLKTASATYLRVMNYMFYDYIENFMKVYLDDIVIKSSSKNGHLDHLRQSFKRMRKHGLKMNPLKCVFGVHVSDFLGFVFHNKGIKINQNKTKAVVSTSAPTTKNLLQSLLGKIKFLKRFILNINGIMQVFHHYF